MSFASEAHAALGMTYAEVEISNSRVAAEFR